MKWREAFLRVMVGLPQPEPDRVTRWDHALARTNVKIAASCEIASSAPQATFEICYTRQGEHWCRIVGGEEGFTLDDLRVAMNIAFYRLGTMALPVPEEEPGG